MIKTIQLLMFLLMFTGVFAATTETIIVDKCNIEVAVMQTSAEHAKGLLGFIEQSYPYGGMLFKMNSNRRKIFHTVGMQMPIRIMGVREMSDGSYKVIGDIFYAKPGIQSIPINAPDVLEIPEQKYQMKYKYCLSAKEGEIL